jgi:hypothetical protein
VGAAQYKAAHGLARSRSLAATALRETFFRRASARVGTASWQRFENARDPTARPAGPPNASAPSPPAPPSTTPAATP